MSIDKRWLLAKVARLYYQERLTQEAIAAQTNFSRSTISRLLQEAQDEGIVEITIHFPWQQVTHLETALCDKFGLDDARVLKHVDYSSDEMLEGLGVLAARYIEPMIEPKMVIAVASGNAVYQTVRALSLPKPMDVNVVQVMGVTGTQNPYVDGAELSRLMADRLGGRYTYIQAPLVVRNPKVRKDLLSEPAISQALELGKKAGLALVGVGTVLPTNSSLLRTGFVTRHMLEEIIQVGAVGETCGRPFTASGEPVQVGIGSQLMSIPLEDLHEIPMVIGVAGGEMKVPALRGILAGRYLNVLVTDEQAAVQLLNEDGG